MNKSNKKYWLLALFYFALTLILIFFIFKFGITVAVKISSFLQQKKLTQDSTELYENIIAEPQLLPLPEATNSAFVKITGYSFPNQKVHLYLNDLDIQTLDVDSEGKFEKTISLSLGLNKIYAITINSKGIQSQPSKSWTIFYNNSPPYLEIFDPPNKTTIKGKEKNVTIRGKIAPTSKVFINDQRLINENDGSFSYQTTLQEGENKFKIICVDPAQNKTELEWILYYQP